MKKIILAFLFCVCNPLCFAQGVAPAIQWQNTIGGSGSDYLYSVKQTFDGGYVLGGWSGSNISGDKTENSTSGNNDYDYWIIKLNSIGNIEWQNTIGGLGNDELIAIELSSNGGFVLGGFSNSNISGDKTENTTSGNSDYDYWIVKLDSSGNIVWQKTIGGTLDDKLYSLEKTLDGGFILAGESSSNISGLKTENTYGNSDYWIVKIDSVGNIQWQKDIGGTLGDGATDVHQTNDYGYIIAGQSNSSISGNKSEPWYGVDDFWVVKLNSNGNIQWQKSLGGNLWEAGGEVIQTSDFGFLVGGTSYSGISGNKTAASYGDFDYWIIKLDSLGNIQWQKDYGSNSSEGLLEIGETGDGNYLLSGNSKTFNFGGVSRNYWVVKIDILGNIIWQQHIGGIEDDEGTCSISTNDYGYLIGGYSNSNISGIKSENCFGFNDYWVIKLAPDNCATCHKPTNLSAVSINHTKEKLFWTTEPCALAYQIRFRKVGTTAWTNVYTTGNWGYKTLNNLTPNTAYQYQVRSICQQSPYVFSFFTALQTFTTPLRLEDETKSQSDFILYPNPSSNTITISSSNLTGNYSLKIYNLLGQVVSEKEVDFSFGEKMSVNISELPSGYYCLTLNPSPKERETVANNSRIIFSKGFVKE